MKELNISRIIVFAVALLLFHVLDGLFIPSEAFSARAFWFIIGYLIQAVIVIAIFAKLAQIQTHLLYVHVVCVFILCELLGFAVLLALGENVLATPIIVMIFDYGLLCVLTIIGTEIGRRLRVTAKKESN
jgi:hypothetical protein